MALRTTGEITANVDRASAFAFISDAHRLAACIPGCSELVELAPGRYSAVVTNTVAFITLRFKVIVELVRVEPPEVIEAKISGDAVGLAGRVSATGAFHLAEAGERTTIIRFVADIVLAGKLGGLGEPVFRATTVKLTREFTERLNAALSAQPICQP